jgi:H+/Cl- antiporter ClcA
MKRNMMKLRTIIGILFVLASLLKLASIWHIIHWAWLERPPQEPWELYFVPVIFILVGANLIYEGLKSERDKR